MTRSKNGAAEVVGDERHALARERAHAAGVIEMVMADDEIPDRLVRHQRARLRDDRERPLVVQRALHDDHVVLHLDHHAVVRAAGHIPHPIGRLLARHPRVGIGRLADGVRTWMSTAASGRTSVTVRSSAGNRRSSAGSSWETSRRRSRDSPRRLPSPACRPGRGRPRRVDALDEVCRVEHRARLEAARDGEGDRAALHGGVARHGCLDDAMRGRPELELTVGKGDRRRYRRVAHHVPGVVAADDEDLSVLAADIGATPPGRIERARAKNSSRSDAIS